MRIGHGFDAHRFETHGSGEDEGITIGGVRIAHERGLAAHSDGDVLIHALCDALLGAAALGDIGVLFPDTDPAFKGADSRVLLREVMAQLDGKGLRVVNADMTIVAQRPRMRPHIEGMRERLSADLGVTPDRVNVKATTTEGMGYTGRGEGIAAHAVVLLESA